MENFDQQNNSDLQVTGQTGYNLNAAAGWARFIAIVLFVFMGIYALAMIAAGSYITMMMETMMRGQMGFLAGSMTIVVLIILGIGGVITWFLLSFGNKMRQGIALNNQQAFAAGWTALRNYLRYAGILSILYYVLMLAVLLLGVGQPSADEFFPGMLEE